MIIIKDIIEKIDVPTVLGFDYDQTISVKNNLRNNSKPLFDYLRQMHIPWFILSARGIHATSVVYDFASKLVDMPQFNISGETHFVHNNCIYCKPEPHTTKLTREIVFSIDLKYRGSMQKVYCGICHNSVACSTEGISDGSYAFEKDLAMEVGLHVYELNPSLIIFIDDNAKNVYRMYRYYKKSSRNVHFVGIIYEPIKPESDHEYFMEKVYKTFAEPVSDLMTEFVDGQHINC